MKLKQLFERIEYEGILPKGNASDIVIDSRKVKQGSVFVCSKGLQTDSHCFAKAALEAGAVLVVCERTLGLAFEVVVSNGREAYALLSAAFYGYPAEKLTSVAVTGTNGKTTVTSILKQILEETGYKAGLIGTMYNQINQMEIPAKYTTPEAGDLHALFARMVEAGCTHVVLEASSQALVQKRLFGIRFHTAVFTNLTQDHLDYHGNMEEYYLAKKQLFSQCDAAVIDVDDAYGKRLARETPCPVITYSDTSDEADYTARNLELRANGIQFEMVGKGFIKRVNFPMPGTYSCQNALAAALSAESVGVPLEQACNALANSEGVRGRCEVLHHGSVTVIRDFAHTADGIENLLAGLKPFVENKMVVLFGCAGDRDRKKRPAMAKAACQYGDYIVFSSDNPRTEHPLQIFADVEPTLQQNKVPYLVELDRRKAVHAALNLLQEGDLLVLCGKGHEDYQVLNNVTVYLNEKQIVQDWFSGREG